MGMGLRGRMNGFCGVLVVAIFELKNGCSFS